MNKLLTRSAAALLLAAATAVSLVAAPGDEAADGQTGPVRNSASPTTTTATPATGSLLLTLEIDSQGVRPLQTLAKPGLAYRPAPLPAARRPFGWVLRDAQGEELARGGFDPAKICLDPNHRGQPPHLEGCVVVPHVAHCNVKVPNFAAATHIEFLRQTAGGAPRLLSKVSRADWQEVR